MGLFDYFSRKEDGADKATLDELVRQTSAERTRIGQDLAALDARRASAESWLAANRAAIVTDYGRLLDAFLSRDAAAVGRAIAAADDRLPVVAAIPVYYSDGVTSVTFATMAAEIFPDHPGLVQRLTAEPGTLPPAALTSRKMEEFYKPDEKAMDSLFMKDPDKVKKMSGNTRENIRTWTDHFRMVLDGLKINGPAEIARKETALNESLRGALDKITVTAGRHRALVDAFDRGDADGVLNTLSALKKADKLSGLLAMGTGRAAIADFTVMALQSFTKPADTARAYTAVVAAGQPIHLDTIAARVLGAGADLPGAVLHYAMAATMAADKRQSVVDLMTSRLADGTPWLAAAQNHKQTEAVLAVAGNDFRLCAAALLTAVDMTADESIAREMRAYADSLTVHGGFVTVAKNVRVRTAAVDMASYSDGALRYSVNGEGWYDKMPAESGRATIRVLSARADMMGLNESAVVNPALTVNVWNGKNGTHDVSLMTTAKTHGVHSAAGDAATVIDHFATLPGWIAAGDEAFNARAVDNAWPQDPDKKKHTIKFLGGGREYYGPVDPSAVDSVFDALIAEDSGLERVGNEIMRMDMIAHAMLVRDGDVNRIEFKSKKYGNLHVEVSEDEGLSVLRRLESAHGHVFVSPWQTIAPSAVDAVYAHNGAADKPALSFSLKGEKYAIPGVDAARAQSLVQEIVRLLPHFEAAGDAGAVNMRHVDAVALTAEGVNLIASDKKRTIPGNRESFNRIAAAHGLMLLTDKLAINAARINLMFHQDGKLTLSNGTGRIALPLKAEQVPAVMDKICAAPIPAPASRVADRALSAAFSCEAAWPPVQKPVNEVDHGDDGDLCAAPHYREKPSPR